MKNLKNEPKTKNWFTMSNYLSSMLENYVKENGIKKSNVIEYAIEKYITNTNIESSLIKECIQSYSFNTEFDLLNKDELKKFVESYIKLENMFENYQFEQEKINDFHIFKFFYKDRHTKTMNVIETTILKK